MRGGKIGNVSKLRHGHCLNGTTSKTYNAWAKAIQRCENPENPRYMHYGGRGISVCERWRRFDAFLADMGEAPSGLTLDRINNDGNYEPSNCRWASFGDQNRNNSRSKLITAFGKTKNLIDWVGETGLSLSCLRKRLSSGWPTEHALSLPSTKVVRI